MNTIAPGLALFPSRRSPEAIRRLGVLANLQSGENEADRSEQERDPESAVCLVAAIALMQRVWPESLGFVHALANRIMTRSPRNGVWTSSSSPHAPHEIVCSICLSDLPQSVETIIHEASHLAIYRFEALSPLQCDSTARYAHPWRPDLRPARGALLAAHAFVNVAGWYVKLDEHSGAWTAGYREEARKTLAGVNFALLQLESGSDLTPLGRVIGEHVRNTADLLNNALGDSNAY